jgi:hypothetical protein
MIRTTALLLALGMILAARNDQLLAQEQTLQECAAREMIPGQLRPLSCRTVAIITNGLARSVTFRGLVDKVGQLNGIVYITDRYYVSGQTRRVLSGALSHRVTMAGAHRVLHLMVAPESGDRPLITLAHELQHAIEVLEAADVATEAAVDRLFERIGTAVSAGVRETQPALDAERAVARELQQAGRLESSSRAGTPGNRLGLPTVAR